MAQLNKVKDFSEKSIRLKIIDKLGRFINFDKNKHWKGDIYIDGVFIGTVKLPNDHPKIMYHNKSKYIADSLKLEYAEFNRLVECPLKYGEYYDLIRAREL